jgi:sirohydrochlorin cobaltochelatase
VSRNLVATLTSWLESSSICVIGEILIRRIDEGFELCHREDAERNDLETVEPAEAARKLALYDEAGVYRPLKTAPNLRRGWRLITRDRPELREALDYFYPAMLGILREWESGSLPTTALRDTLARQSGMYAVTRKISDAQANELIGRFCNSETGCLKSILWRISDETPITSLPAEKFHPQRVCGPRAELPLLCHEACNLLVAKVREIVKASAKPVPMPPGDQPRPTE